LCRAVPNPKWDTHGVCAPLCAAAIHLLHYSVVSPFCCFAG